MSFRPRAAIVTASDSGIGRSTAIALAESGLDVGITWHSDEDGARQTAQAVQERGRRASVRRLDVADLERCGDVVDDLADELGASTSSSTTPGPEAGRRSSKPTWRPGARRSRSTSTGPSW